VAQHDKRQKIRIAKCVKDGKMDEETFRKKCSKIQQRIINGLSL
jgi:hypothetical protein